MGIDPRAAVFLLLLSLVLACVPLGALLAWRGRRAAGLAVLVPAVALLVVATVLTALSIGWTLLPADVVAGVVLLMAARQRSAPLDQPSSTSM